MIWLAIATAILVLLLFWILWTALARVSAALMEIGGPTTSSPASVMAKIRWGVRAIERQTDGFVPRTRELADNLAALANAFSSIGGPARERTAGRSGEAQ